MGLFYFVGFLVLASAVTALPKSPKDAYKTEFEIQEYQQPYEDPISADEMEAQLMMNMLPVAITRDYIRLDKYQAAAAFKLAKSILKPIIKSQEFRYSVKAFEQFVSALKYDPEIKKNVREAVDAVEAIYQSTDSRVVKELLTWLLSQYTDENTARSVSTIWSDVSPYVNQWVVYPVLKYYKAWLNPAISSLREGVVGFMGEDISSNTIGRSYSWSDYADVYISRVTEMISGASQMVEATARFLEMQDTEERTN